MRIDLPDYLSETIPVDDANGTVIWRRSGDRVTVLSDNIAIRNADFESQSNVQVTLDAGVAPVIAEAQLRVVAATPTLAYMTERLGGDDVSVTPLEELLCDDVGPVHVVSPHVVRAPCAPG